MEERQVEQWKYLENMEIKSKLNNEKIWTIETKRKLNSEMIWKIQKIVKR